jgi:hypothetical protein
MSNKCVLRKREEKSERGRGKGREERREREKGRKERRAVYIVVRGRIIREDCFILVNYVK